MNADSERVLLADDRNAVGMPQPRPMDEQLLQSQKLEAVGRLAGGVAHGFNNLLQVILGYGNYALEACPAGDPLRDDVQEIIAAATRAATLTKQLLTYGRRQVMNPDTIDLGPVLSDLVAMLRPILGSHIQVEIVLGRTLRPVYADSAMVQQAITNLCLNARDAMPAGGRLTIEVENVLADQALCLAHPKLKAGPYLRLRISDTGHGIAPDCLEHVFEPFFTTKGIGEGTGLNLAMVYGIVEQHQGAIDVQSTPRGTCFAIHLPAVAEKAAESNAREPAPATGSETILVAEDEPAISVYISRILKKAGYTVLTAGDGEQAVDLFRTRSDSISLVLLDMIMPKQTGRSVYEAIRALQAEVPVIFLSGYDPGDSQVAFVRNQDLDLLQKPINREQLVRTVRRLIDARKGAARAKGSLPLTMSGAQGALDSLAPLVAL